MKRLFFHGENAEQAVMLLFGQEKWFDPKKYDGYRELELVWQDDGSFSLWGNQEDDSELLQDTRRDPQGLVQRVLFLADEILEDDEEPEDFEEDGGQEL